jgi:hypothetical protein
MSHQEVPGLHTGALVWKTVHLNRVGYTPGDYKVLNIPGSPFVALKGNRPNTWVVVHAESGQISRYTRGTKADARLALVQSERSLLQDLELARQQEAERPMREAEEKRRLAVFQWTTHGPGLYITPFCKVEDEESDNEEGVYYGPYRDNENGAGTRDDAVKTYYELLNKNPDVETNLIEADSRENAVKMIGHIWIANGLEKGPPVDPRQLGLSFERQPSTHTSPPRPSSKTKSAMSSKVARLVEKYR